jgi:hypothetical protein
MSEKKLYEVGCYTPEDWQHIHEVLLQDGSLEDNIPSRHIDVADSRDHSETRAVYLLDEEEVEQLKNHPKVRYVSLDYDSYFEDIMPPAEKLYATPITERERLPSAVKNYRNFFDSGDLPDTPTIAEAGRTGYQILRCTQKENQWAGGPSNTVISDTITINNGGAPDVDVIVGDDGCWFGHVEFQSNATGTVNPIDYVGGNLFGGTCDLMDLALDAPYYIDPAWFNANPGSRLTTRWDGATVPTEAEAKAWWSNANNRSVQFLGAGTVTIPVGYTRSFCTGSNTSTSSVGNHGTPCCAATYGRTQGWAYNANKWFVNVYNTNGTGIGVYFDMMKIFHQSKPTNPTYGTKDPTVSSNSWGYRDVPPFNGYYYYRVGFNLDRTDPGVAYVNKNLGPFDTSNTAPGFMRWVGYYGDADRMKSEFIDNAWTTAGEELINAGVIFVVAAGNANQKQVEPDHPDFNNYFNLTANASIIDGSFENLGISVFPTTNRRGFPQHLGKTPQYVYPAINVGALDDSFTANGLERKVNYSDMGNSIDCYAPADGILTAQRTISSSSGNNKLRYDTYSGGTPSMYDGKFSGTSAACPVATGLIASLLSQNRDWSWREVRNYLKNGLERQRKDHFYYGRESRSANDPNWSDVNSLEGGEGIVIYERPAGGKIDAIRFAYGDGLTISGPLNIKA